MKKLFIYYGVYLLTLFLLFSKKIVNITHYRGGKAIGIIIILMLSGLLIYLTLDAIKSENIKRLSAENQTEKPKTEMEKLQEFAECFSRQTVYSVSQMVQDELLSARETASYLYTRFKEIDRLLTETFSVTDLTYATYKDNISQIIHTVNINFAAIRKRFSMFRDEWTSDNAIAVVYEKEIQSFLTYNTEIRDKVEELTLELVRLGDSDQKDDMSKLTELIEQTKEYSIVRQEI